MVIKHFTKGDLSDTSCHDASELSAPLCMSFGIQSPKCLMILTILLNISYSHCSQFNSFDSCMYGMIQCSEEEHCYRLYSNM